MRRELLQPWGLVHGGVYASIAESLASWATAMAVIPGGETAMGQSNNTSFLRPVLEGTIHALATRRHRGRTSWVWDVDFSDDAGRLCATSRVTIAVRPAGPGPTRASQPRKRLVIGIRRSRPNARSVILMPGGAWRRLYSARSTSPITRSIASAGRPRAISSSRPRSSST